ncbi:MAG: monofunctional biosynthetic peptidoglycan transglycosylase [Bacteroidales bacterium]
MAKKKNFLGKIWRIIRWIIILFFGSSILLTILYRFVPPPFTPLMLIRVTEQLTGSDPVRLKKDWVSLDKISNNLEQAVVAAEDNEFMEHYGFDFEAIKKAQEYNKKHKRTKGASTISQQTAKNVFLWPQRSWVRKGLEVYFTGLIEVFWGKRRIMEVYLNVIEMGKGIYGAEMAARTYFNKPASKLTKAESALIAACLPNPRLYSVAKPSPYIIRKQGRILMIMNKIEKVDFEK